MQLVRHSDDGAAQIVDFNSHRKSNPDGEGAVLVQLAVDLCERAVDHLAGPIAHRHLQSNRGINNKLCGRVTLSGSFITV